MRARQLLTVIAMFAAVLVFPLFASPQAIAQDATPTATCVAPELPPDEATDPNSTPAAMVEEAVAEEAAPVNEGPASRNIAASAHDGLDNVLNCINEGSYLGLAALMTPGMVASVTESGNPYDVPASMEGVMPIRIVMEGSPVIDTNNRVGLHIVYGDFFNVPGELSSQRFYMVKAGDYWLLDETRDVPAPADVLPGATIVEVQMVDFAFSLSSNTIPAGPVILMFTNSSYSDSPHVAGLVTLTEGITAEQIIQMETLPDEPVTGYFGGTFVEAGQTSEILLEILDPGTYTLACDFETPDGVSHHRLAMVPQFTVEAAIE